MNENKRLYEKEEIKKANEDQKCLKLRWESLIKLNNDIKKILDDLEEDYFGPLKLLLLSENNAHNNHYEVNISYYKSILNHHLKIRLIHLWITM